MEMESYYSDLIRYFSERIILSDSDIKLIISAYEFRVLKKKEFLFHQGEVCRYEAFVIKGACKLYYSDLKGADHILYFAFIAFVAFIIEFTTIRIYILEDKRTKMLKL